MFNIPLEYPSYDEQLEEVKSTTGVHDPDLRHILSKDEIQMFQRLIRQIPIAENVLEYAVKLVHKTRPEGEQTHDIVREYIQWGAGPRASQYHVKGAICHAALHGNYSLDL